jgi:phage-related protein
MTTVTWRVEILDHRAVKELDALAPDVRQRFLRIAELIEKHGMAAMHEALRQALGGQVVGDEDEGQGWHRSRHLRACEGRTGRGRARLREKTHKTPQNALEIARQRAKEVT